MADQSGSGHKGIWVGLMVAVFVSGLAWLQGTKFAPTLSSDTLRRGRIVLSSGDEEHFVLANNREGSARLVLDGDPKTFSTLYFPSDHPEGTHFLADLALSHFPGNPPVSRKPTSLHFLNGPAAPADFEDYARPREVRIAMLARRANDPDVENLIPDAHVIWQSTLTFPDSRDYTIQLPIPMAESSTGYPENVKLWILKVTVLSIYPGKKYFHNVAIREIDYIDSDASSNVTTWSAKQ
ncbi:MAG: hypothetical protein K8S54_08030 [Spirochaetia bacterium]|nr:hypothetical protein [Spirochaetia bacterium]